MNTTNPSATIYDLLCSYAAGSLSPRPVFERAVHLARSAFRDANGSGDGRNEWVYVISDTDVSQQLSYLDSLQAAKASLPLYGVPFAVKDNIDVAGVPTTAACPQIAYTPKVSAHCVQRLRNAGALFVGKTNLDQFATGLVGTRSPFGAVPSTFDNSRVSGGSSSGSAAVVSRGVVPFSLGTDTAGSGRVPAAFNGIIGLKPSVGRVSTQGILPACASLDCVSVFALTASDAARVLAVLESAPTHHPSNDVRFARPPLGPASFPHPLRVGVPNKLVDCMSAEFCLEFKRACAKLNEQCGADLISIDMSTLHEVAVLLYDGPWISERFLALAKVLHDNPGAVHPTVRAIVLPGGEVLAQDAFRGLHKLARLRHAAEAIMDNIDVLLVPSAPHHPTMQEVEKEPIRKNSELGSYTNFVNLLGWCALATPFSTIQGTGAPFGITWISRAGNDTALLKLACETELCEDISLGAPGAKISATKEARTMPDATHAPQSEKVLQLAVVGAHLAGMPLHRELVACRARLVRATKTAPSYKLYALSGTVPAKPGLVRVETGGQRIEIEVYAVPVTEVGKFLAGVPHPLGLGSVETQSGEWVTGFICEAIALGTAMDVTDFGGWRSYIAALKNT